MSRWDGLEMGHLTCRELVALVADYLDDRLDAATRARFDEHVAECPGCARYLDQIRASARALGRVSLESVTPEARAQLLDAFRSWRAGRGDAEGPAGDG